MSTTATEPTRRRLRAEVLIVLGLSLGQSAVFAALRLLERYLAEPAIGQQATTLNPSRSGIPYMDLTYQLLSIGFGLVPVALTLYLLSNHGASARARLGLTGSGRRWGRDIAIGACLAACIGLPGLGVYAIGRAIGQSVRINTNGLPEAWWAATILLLSAAAAALLEEIVVVGYLLTRLSDMKWSVPAAIAASALLRGTYHLYQGWPMALGNVLMGVVVAYVFLRWRRVGAGIAAHFLLGLV